MAASLTVFASCEAPAVVESRVITIRSNVSGAAVEVDGKTLGHTPFQGQVVTNRFVAELHAEGFQIQTVPLSTSFRRARVLDLFLDYSITMHGGESVWEYAPDAYYVELRRTNQPVPGPRSRTSLKALVMTFYADIQLELSADGGPTVRVLQAEFFSKQTRAEFLAMLREAPADDPVAFAEFVAARAPFDRGP